MRISALVLSLALACSALSASAYAQTEPPQSASVDLPSGEYRLDPRHASVIFRIQHMGLSWFTARFDSVDGTLTLNADDLAQSRLVASVGADSVNTGVLNGDGQRNFDAQIGRAIGAEATPRISFTSTTIERTGDNTGRVTGDLTMNGQTHPVTLDCTFYGGHTDILRGGMALGFAARGSINRRDWGVNEWSAFTGDEVTLSIEAEFVKH